MGPHLDFVFTVCDKAAGELCPYWPGQPMTAHWGIPDPAAVQGTEIEKGFAFRQAFRCVGDANQAFLEPAARQHRSECGSKSAWTPSAKRPPRHLRDEYFRTLSHRSGYSSASSIGIALGQFLPGVFQVIGGLSIAQVNLPVGILIWIMIIPMLVKVDFGALGQIRRHVKGIGVTLFVNWLVKPFSMALLGWLFIRHIFAALLPADQLDSYIAGLILLAAAPCTAMVFVWSRLTNGDPLFTLSQVALNDSIMVVAFAPLVGLLLGISAITVPWGTLLTSVVLYIVIPVALAQVWRGMLLKRGVAAFEAAMHRMGPWSIGALLTTLVLLFAFQGEEILQQPLVIALLAVPILVQVLFNSALAYWLNRALGEKHNVACPSALIGASNFFELAVAAAISLFGFHSGAALATVVGVLIEVPVMLLVVNIVNRSKDWYEHTGIPATVKP